LIRDVIVTESRIDLRVFNMEAAEDTWRAFEQHADCTAFQRFDWLAEWHRHIGINRNMTPVIVLGIHQGLPVCLLPLAIEGRAIRRLIWLGSELCDYNTPLLAKNFRDHVRPGQFAQLWDRIVRAIRAVHRIDLIELSKMPDVVGSQPNPFGELPIMVANVSSHAVTLPPDWQPPKVSDRRNRYFKKLERLHGPVCLIHTQGDDIQRTLTLLVEQKRSSLARMGVEDIFSRPGYMEFYRAVATNPRLHDVVHVSRIDAGDTPIAAALGLKLSSVYLYVLNSYDREFSQYGAGYIHIQRLLQYAVNHKFRKFDFTIGDEPYKFDWCDIHDRLFSHLCANTFRGSMAAAFHILVYRVDTWYHQHPLLEQALRKMRRYLHGSFHT
jgi:CelD/BcsL family acetyltransferase involved in cellulose biosynthesis